MRVGGYWFGEGGEGVAHRAPEEGAGGMDVAALEEGKREEWGGGGAERRHWGFWKRVDVERVGMR